MAEKEPSAARRSGDVPSYFAHITIPRLTLADYAYLLALHPLDLWCAGELRKQPNLAWEKLYAASS